ncbi:MAG: hypothetical protein ACOCZ8_01280 [Bacteroidota bacterium]
MATLFQYRLLFVLLCLLLPLNSFSGERPQSETRTAQMPAQIWPNAPSPSAELQARETTAYSLPQHAQWQLENTVPKAADNQPDAARSKTRRERREKITSGLNKWMAVVTGPFIARAIQRKLKKKDYWKQIMYTLGIILVGVGLMVASRQYGGTSFGGNNVDWLFRFMWPFGLVLVGIGGILLVLAVYYIIREIKKEKEKEREKERARKAAERRKKEAEKRRQEQQKDKQDDDRDKQLTPEELKQKQREYLEQKRKEEFERRDRETQPPPNTTPPNERQPKPDEAKPLNPPPAEPPPNSKDEGPPVEKQEPRKPEPKPSPPPRNERRSEPDRD